MADFQMTRKAGKAFTLIELLVVIAIIALLLSIVVPSLRKAKEYTKKTICRANFRQIGIAIASYESDNNFNFRRMEWVDGDDDHNNKTWLFTDGSADYAHEYRMTESEDYGNRMHFYLMQSGILPDSKIFFCPSVRNLAFDKNYAESEMTGGATPVSRNTQSILDDDERPAFWSSYVWVYKKQKREDAPDIVSVNNLSSGAMMLDMTDFCWDVITNSDIGQSAENLGIEQTIYHYNVLMHDLSVVNPTDKDEEMNPWLWDDERWAGTWD